MKHIYFNIVVLIILSILLSACGPSQAERGATATQGAVDNFATQTAQAPTATSTLEPTSTATCTPTPTSVPTATTVPTATPNQTATARAVAMEGIIATQHAEQTAEAVSAQATQQAVDDLWALMVSDGSITYSRGELYTVDDFEESWAQLYSYQIWSFGYDLADFVIMTHIEWEHPEHFSGGACGFAFRFQDENRHLVVVLTTNNYAGLDIMTPNGYLGQTVRWYIPYPNLTTTPTGGADFMVAAQGEIVTAYINGVKTLQWYVARTNRGDIGYTIQSGTNIEPGTTCSFTDTRIWELVR